MISKKVTNISKFTFSYYILNYDNNPSLILNNKTSFLQNHKILNYQTVHPMYKYSIFITVHYFQNVIKILEPFRLLLFLIIGFH